METAPVQGTEPSGALTPRVIKERAPAGIKKFGDVYRDSNADLPLVNFTSLAGEAVIFHSIEESQTAMGDGYRMVVSLPGDEGKMAVLSQPNVITKQLLRAAKERNLPIEATVVEKQGKKYPYFILT